MTGDEVEGEIGMGSGCDWSIELSRSRGDKQGTRPKRSSFIRHFRHDIVYGPEEANIKLTKGCNTGHPCDASEWLKLVRKAAGRGLARAS
jgi:hypothetical protein